MKLCFRKAPHSKFQDLMWSIFFACVRLTEGRSTRKRSVQNIVIMIHIILFNFFSDKPTINYSVCLSVCLSVHLYLPIQNFYEANFKRTLALQIIMFFFFFFFFLKSFFHHPYRAQLANIGVKVAFKEHFNLLWPHFLKFAFKITYMFSKEVWQQNFQPYFNEI